MTKKNIASKINVLISSNFIKSMKSEFKKHWSKDISLFDIKSEIKKLLIYEGKIDKNTLINFEEITDRFQGVIIENNEIICFTQKLDNHNKTKGRNTFFSQNLPPIYKTADKYKIKNKSVSLNPFDVDQIPKIPDHVKNSFRQVVTLNNLNLNNSIRKLGNCDKFHSLSEYLETISKTRDKNKGNFSTLIQENSDKSITIYGKLDGANFSDTIEKCKMTRKLSNQNTEIFFYIISPMHSKINQIKEEFKRMNIKFGPNEININNLKNQSEKLLPRDQDLFRSNIIKRYIENNIDITKCFASSYDITQNLIASHIHRVVDIRKEYLDKKIDYQKAKYLLVSGNNGFLLSPNKDKEFENGQIYFDIKLKKFMPNKQLLTTEQYKNLYKSLETQLNLTKIQITNEFIENNKKHQKRTGNIKI
ncbi:MAG: hypothetical protein J6Y96_00980 [Mycoplasma sp.]|nr:hypothetical protein [Mycoplasma sp.]